jgi:LDH2 family malate/lactate/ureidoglycolate dehydrogenase
MGPAALGAPPARFGVEALTDWAQALLVATGLDAPLAADVAQVLVEGDLLGHDTHGLALLSGYLNALEQGSMTASGTHVVLTERTVAATWDGQRLPGPALVLRAIDWAAPRARQHGCATVAIRRSHHIACLAAYLERPARDGLLVELYSSDPAVASVAPYGGTQAVFTPNPMAFGIPTSTDPMMIDVSASVTTNGMSHRMAASGQRGGHTWWLDALGAPSDDPAVLNTQPPGTILPLGGLDAGHKGYGLALAIEALTGGLAGHGRADVPEGWGATVCVRLTDPEAFGGLAPFTWQTDWIAQACRTSAPRDPAQPVRLPGERALARKREQQRDGVALHPTILPALARWSQRHALPAPAPLA